MPKKEDWRDKELVEYLDEFVDELRDVLMDPRVVRDNRWKQRPFMRNEMKELPFRKGARRGKLGMQMAKESLIMWIRENVPDEEKERGRGRKPCDGC